MVWKMLYYTSKNRFSGSSAKEVVQALYQDSANVTQKSFPEWLEYQKTIWQAKYEFEMPNSLESEEDCRIFIDFLLKIKVLSLFPSNKNTANF